MKRFGKNPCDDKRTTLKKEENAFKKVQALRSRCPPLFWAVGPGGLNYAFGMGYADDGSICFQEVAIQELAYSPGRERPGSDGSNTRDVRVGLLNNKPGQWSS